MAAPPAVPPNPRVVNLERESRNERHRPRIARIDTLEIIEVSRSRDQEIASGNLRRQVDIVQLSWHKLRVIEHVICPSAELKTYPLAEREFLHQRHVEVVDVIGWKRVAT